MVREGCSGEVTNKTETQVITKNQMYEDPVKERDLSINEPVVSAEALRWE